MNWELPDVKDGFRRGRRIRDQIGKIHLIIEKAREYQKKQKQKQKQSFYVCFID